MAGPKWSEIEVGRTTPRWLRIVGWVFFGVIGVFVVALFAVGSVMTVKSAWWRWDIHEHGVNGTAMVLDGITSDDGDGGTDKHLVLAMPGCNSCTATVAVSSFQGYDNGSDFPVRYDPRHPTHAEPLANAPSWWSGWAVAGGFIVLVGIALGFSIPRAVRRRRRNRELLAFTDSTCRVTARAWSRGKGEGSKTYLELFQEGDGAASMLCVPVNPNAVKKLHAGEVLALYGTGEPGTPLALRHDDLVIFPNAETRPGAWEREFRNAQHI